MTGHWLISSAPIRKPADELRKFFWKLSSISRPLMLPDPDPLWFIATYCAGPFPNRDSVLTILQTRSYLRFSSPGYSLDTRPPLTCDHYTGIFRVRVSGMERRLAPSPERDRLLAEMRHLNARLGETPNEPCILYSIELEKEYYALYCRPETADVGACLLLRRSSISDESQPQISPGSK